MSISRRRLMKSISLGSLMGALPSWIPSIAPGRAANPYDQLGIRPVINFRGTMTNLGASKMWDDLHEAARQASREYVLLDELRIKIGERLAGLIGCEDALVTTGAAGAIALGTCAALTGSDTGKIRQLPDLAGMKTEVVVQKAHRTGYDHAVRSAGVKLREVETEDELLQVSDVGPVVAASIAHFFAELHNREGVAQLRATSSIVCARKRSRGALQR